MRATSGWRTTSFSANRVTPTPQNPSGAGDSTSENQAPLFILAIIGGDDAGHERMAHHVLFGESGDTHPTKSLRRRRFHLRKSGSTIYSGDYRRRRCGPRADGAPRPFRRIG